MQTLQLDLPAHWACALINDDTSGLDPSDERALQLFINQMITEYGICWPLDVSDGEGDFMHYHSASPFGVGGCLTLLFTFDVTPY